jgi:hypothetical protein
MSGRILVPISTGELFDKISILEIKSERIADQSKLANVNFEIQLLKEIARELKVEDSERVRTLFLKLKDVNTQIWEAEDKIRNCERRDLFNGDFLEIARTIYRLNDARAAVKREISILTSSSIIEEKSYGEY